MILGVDSTPLVNPCSGAGRYTLNTLRYMVTDDIELVFLGPRPRLDVLAVFPQARVVIQKGRRVSWYMVTLRRMLKKAHCDAFWGFPLPVTRATGIRYITSVLDLYPLQLPDLESWSWKRRVRTFPQRLLIHWLIARSIKVADEVVALSHATGRDIQKYFGVTAKRIAYPAPGITEATPVECERERLPLALLSGRFVLAVGGYEPYRNRRRLLEAFSKLPVNEGHLVIAGRFSSKEERLEYITLRDSYGVTNRVHFLSDVSDQLLAWLYRRTIGVIHPTLCEGFGMPVVEALSFGQPVAISSAGSLPEAAGGLAATQFDPQSTTDISRALALLLSLPTSTDEEIQERKAYAHRYTWAHTAEVTWQAIIGSS